MKRSASITLVLLGTGISLSACGESAADRACREAQAAGRLDAAQLCARAQASNRASHLYLGSWYYGAHGGGDARGAGGTMAARSAAVSRGGFGARGASGG